MAHLGRGASEQRASAVDIGPGKRSVLRHPLVTWSGWLVAASLAAIWALGPRRPAGQGMAGMSMGPLDPGVGRQHPREHRRCGAARLQAGRERGAAAGTRAGGGRVAGPVLGARPDRAAHAADRGLDHDDRRRARGGPGLPLPRSPGRPVRGAGARLLPPAPGAPGHRGRRVSMPQGKGRSTPSAGPDGTTAPSSSANSPPPSSPPCATSGNTSRLRSVCLSASRHRRPPRTPSAHTPKGVAT